MNETRKQQLDHSRFHVKGIVEAQESLKSLLKRLEAAGDLDDEVLAETLVSIRVEVFDHIGYHMKELRAPLREVTDSIYATLPPRPPEESRDASN